MDSSRFFKIDSLIYFDTLLISKLNINKVQYKTLLRHPYLNKYQTNAIMKYRELAGKFHNVNQLFEYNLLKEEDFFRIKPYLTADTLK
jgi:DNA uptake protein ComE-like DNA-binding protein